MQSSGCSRSLLDSRSNRAEISSESAITRQICRLQSLTRSLNPFDRFYRMVSLIAHGILPQDLFSDSNNEFESDTILSMTRCRGFGKHLT